MKFCTVSYGNTLQIFFKIQDDESYCKHFKFPIVQHYTFTAGD